MDALSAQCRDRRGWRRRHPVEGTLDLRDGPPGGPRVLILGDGLGAAGTWEALLGAAGMEVTTAPTTELPGVPDGPAPDLIILSDGGCGDGPLLLLGRMRAEDATARVPVILVTAGPRSGMAAALSAGADDCLCQPVRGTELVARVRARIRDLETSA